MSATVLTLTVEPGMLDTHSCWSEFVSLVVQMGKELPGQALASVLEDAQGAVDRFGVRAAVGSGRGAWRAPFACPRCEMAEDFARKGKRARKRKLHIAAGTVELVL